MGAPLARLSKLLDRLAEVGAPAPVLLPSVLGHLHVEKVRNLSRQLDYATYGRDSEISTAAAAWAMRLLDDRGIELFLPVEELSADWFAIQG